MLEPQLPTEEAIASAYATLGIPLIKRTEILEDANIALRLAFSRYVILDLTDGDLDRAAVQLASSSYAKDPCRMPLVNDAAKGGAFSDQAARIILNTSALRKNLQHIDLRDVPEILLETARTFGRRSPGPDLIGQLTCVGVLCMRLKGFDPEAKLIRLFRTEGRDFTQFARVIRKLGLENDTMEWLKNQAERDAAPGPNS